MVYQAKPEWFGGSSSDKRLREFEPVSDAAVAGGGSNPSYGAAPPRPVGGGGSRSRLPTLPPAGSAEQVARSASSQARVDDAVRIAFEKYDLDHSGELSKDEAMMLIAEMNLTSVSRQCKCGLLIVELLESLKRSACSQTWKACGVSTIRTARGSWTSRSLRASSKCWTDEAPTVARALDEKERLLVTCSSPSPSLDSLHRAPARAVRPSLAVSPSARRPPPPSVWRPPCPT